MFDSGRLRCAVLVVTAAMLTTGCGRAPESEGDGPKMEFVRIPAGSFQMGSSAIEEDRVHKVRITKPFYMGKYEVTQAQWEAVMGTTVRQQRDKADVP
jgi:formylglycine-generating enzyme required for sulfatase activity